MKYQDKDTGITFSNAEVREMFDEFLNSGRKEGEPFAAPELYDNNPEEYESQFKAYCKWNGWEVLRKA